MFFFLDFFVVVGLLLLLLLFFLYFFFSFVLDITVVWCISYIGTFYYTNTWSHIIPFIFFFSEVLIVIHTSVANVSPHTIHNIFFTFTLINYKHFFSFVSFYYSSFSFIRFLFCSNRIQFTYVYNQPSSFSYFRWFTLISCFQNKIFNLFWYFIRLFANWSKLRLLIILIITHHE